MKFINKRFDLKLTVEEKERALNIFLNSKIEKIADKKIIDVCKKDGVKFYLEGNNDWILIRFSGTEPLLRIYFESLSMDFIEKAYQEIQKLIA